MFGVSIPHKNASPNKVCNQTLTDAAWKYVKTSAHNFDFVRLYGRDFEYIDQWRRACKSRTCQVDWASKSQNERGFDLHRKADSLYVFTSNV
jgi:hypothetical protein